MNPNELRGRREQRLKDADTLLKRAGEEKRELTPEETAKFDEIMAEVGKIDESLKRIAQLANVQAAPEAPETSGERSAGRRVPAGTLQRSAQLGMDPKEARRYSMLRAIRACVTGDWRGAELEREASEAVEARLGRSPQSFFVPYDVLITPRNLRGRGERRDLNIGTAADGGYLKATDLDSASFIDLLRNKMIVQQAGATVLTGLVGDVDIPRQTGGATAYWVAEAGEPTESQQAFDKVTLQPKTVGAFTELTRKFIQQSSIDGEAFVENDLSTTLALEIDRAALHGSGASNQPTGVASTAGIGSVVGGTNGLAPTWAHVVELETDVSVANADVGTLAYISNAKVRGKLKTTEITANSGQFIWPANGDNVNGYKFHVSNQVASNLTKGTSSGVCSAIFYGNWADLMLAMWGGLDILVNPYANDKSGGVRVVAFQDVDVKVRHAESFSAMLDALTA
jgi:HK97 family phage major capsid protein